MTLMVSASPPPIPTLATTATSPFGEISIPYGCRPAAICRFVTSTLLPSMDSTEMRLSPSRVTSALLPSGVNTTWQGPESGAPILTVPAGVTVVPLIVNTETVPSERFATNASVPALLMETPAAPLPACRVARTFGTVGAPLAPAPTAERRRATRLGFKGERSITVSLSSGTCLVGSPASICIAPVTRAMSSLGDMATLIGGPTTLVGASISANTLGGDARRSMKVTVSAPPFCTSVLPFTSLSLASLAEIAISASAGTAQPSPTSAAATTASNPSLIATSPERLGLQPTPRVPPAHTQGASTPRLASPGERNQHEDPARAAPLGSQLPPLGPLRDPPALQAQAPR